MISRRRQILQSLTVSNTNYHSYRSYQNSAKILCSTSFVGIQVPSNHIRATLSLSPFPSWGSSFSPMLQRPASISFHSTVAHNKEIIKKVTHSSDDDEDRFHPSCRFEDLNLHPQTLKALRRQGLHRLTEIQEKTYDFILNGHNLVARSRTGTGKTLAFLVPSLERQLLREQQYNNNDDTISTSIDKFKNNFRIPILVLAPTRELAAQIHKEAEKLLSIHDNHRDRSSKLSAQVIYGGVPKEEDVRRFQSRLPTILVATPGRLKDHL